MAAEAVRRQHRAFEVERRADAELAQRGQRQGFAGRIDDEAARVEFDHGQAAAVDRDALAELYVIEGQRADLDGQARIAATRFARGKATHACDQSGEHQWGFLEACTNSGQRTRCVGASPQACSNEGTDSATTSRPVASRWRLLAE